MRVRLVPKDRFTLITRELSEDDFLQIKHNVDFISVRTREKTFLDKYMKSIVLPKFNGHDHRLYYRELSEECFQCSAGSQATYPGMHVKKGILVQVLPPNCKTSHHYHNNVVETFINLEGECMIMVDKVANKLKQGVVQVTSGHAHQLKTGAKAALNLLHMDPFAPIADENFDHHYVKEDK